MQNVIVLEIVQQGRRSAVAGGGQEYRCTAHPRHIVHAVKNGLHRDGLPRYILEQ